MAADLWVTWQAVLLQLSFVEKYRPLIVYHGDGQVFSHLKVSARLPPILSLCGSCAYLTRVEEKGHLCSS